MGGPRGVRTMYGSVSLYSRPFALLRAGVSESAPNFPQSEHPATSTSAGRRPSHPFARPARQGPPRRVLHDTACRSSGRVVAVDGADTFARIPQLISTRLSELAL